MADAAPYQPADAPVPGSEMAHFSIRSEVRAAGVVQQHTHSSFEVLLLLAGHRVMHLALRDIECRPGDMFFMPPGVPHGATVHDENQSLFFRFNLAFLRPELPATTDSYWDEPNTVDAIPELLPFAAQSHFDVRCTPRLARRLRDMGMALQARHGSASRGALAYARAQVSLMLLEVVSEFERPLVRAASEREHLTNPARVNEFFTFLQDHFGENVTLNEAARHVHMSPSSLRARVKRVTGKTFSELLMEVRLLRARNLLLYSDRRVSDIAFSCGFGHHSYFSRCFRQVIGVSPNEYRRRYHAAKSDPRVSEEQPGGDAGRSRPVDVIDAATDARRRVLGGAYDFTRVIKGDGHA